LPQFLLYARHANEQKVYKLDLKSVDDYIGQIFGKGKPTKMAEDDPNNYVWQIKKAKESLIEKTGRSEFSLKEVWAELHSQKKKKE